ncbi:MAG TPA: LysR family transcriptional regulator [Azoarcus taiwanensis]|jgi:LysR family transcriptional regulator of abg operon|nr:LysR family transcriptional regulator [Azoarcus taiwanensis]
MFKTPLRYLELILEHGTFAAAARQAGVSQPAVSKAITELQKTLGVRLFEKSGHRLVPNAQAYRAVQAAVRFQTELDALRANPDEALAGSTGAEVPALRIGLAPASALLYGPSIEKIWHAHHREGFLQLISGSAPELMSRLRQRDLHLIIAPHGRREATADLQWRKLHMSEPTVYVRTGHPVPSLTTLEDICDARWAVAGNPGTVGHVIEEAHHVRKLPPPRVVVQCHDYHILLTLVANSDLFCLVPHPCLLRTIEPGSVRAIRLREGLPKYEVHLTWLRDMDERFRPVIQSLSTSLTPVGDPE